MLRINKIKSHPLLIPVTEVIAKAISFINVLLLIRVFSINEYADYSYLISIILWASVLMDSGINDLIYNKSLKKDLGEINSLFTGKIFLSLIVVIFLGFFFALSRKSLFLSGLLLSFIIAFSSLTALLKMYSRGNHLVKNDMITILSEPVLRLFFLIIIILSGSVISWSFEQVLFIYLLASLITFLINRNQLKAIHRFKLIPSHLIEPYTRLMNILKDTKYFLLYYLMLIGLQRLDIIMLEKYGSKTDLAIFSSSVTIYQVVYLFFYALITAKILILINNKNYLFRYIMPALVIIVILTFLISPFLYSFLFPEAYYTGYKTLNYLMISIIPSIISLYFIIKNNYEGKVKNNFYFLSFVLAIKFILYSVLKPSDLTVYYTIYGMMELLLVLIFIIYPDTHENTPNK